MRHVRPLGYLKRPTGESQVTAESQKPPTSQNIFLRTKHVVEGIPTERGGGVWLFLRVSLSNRRAAFLTKRKRSDDDVFKTIVNTAPFVGKAINLVKTLTL